MGLSFSNVSSILQAVATVYQNRNSILAIIGAAPPSFESIVEELGQKICADLEKIYDAVKQNSLVQEWKGIADTLNYAHSTLVTLNAELATVQQDQSGNIWILAGADQQKVSFENWCMGWTDGDGTEHRSALTRISELIGTDVIIHQGLTISSLSGIFSTVTPGGGSGGMATDAIGTWTAMLQLAKENPGVTNLSGSFRDETQYESLLRLMNYVYELITMSLYVHDAALLLLQQAKLPTNGHNSLFNGISQNFGNWVSPESPWGVFAAEFSSLASGSINTQAGNNQAAYAVATNRADFAHVTNDIPYNTSTMYARGGGNTTTYPYTWCYCADQVSLAGSGYTNAFFSSLGFTEINPEGSPNYGFNLYLAVQGNVVQIGENMEMTTQGMYPPASFYTDASKWSGTNEYTNSFTGVNTYEGTYVNVQEPGNNNHIKVITGFQLLLINNRQGGFNVALALQFGILDVTNPLNPVVTIEDTTFHAPDYTQALEIQAYYCVNQSGNYDSKGKCMRPAILTNAAICRLTNGDNALNVQAAPSIYKADFMQPAALQQVVNNLPATAPATATA